jgi:hypothetical protein
MQSQEKSFFDKAKEALANFWETRNSLLAEALEKFSQPARDKHGEFMPPLEHFKKVEPQLVGPPAGPDRNFDPEKLRKQLDLLRENQKKKTENKVPRQMDAAKLYQQLKQLQYKQSNSAEVTNPTASFPQKEVN